MKSLSVLILFWFAFSGLMISQNEIKEKVDVVNREIIVRVMYKGEPVGNLNKSDFKLLVNGKEVEINGFFVKSQSLGIQNIEMDSTLEKKVKKRFFVLAFSLTRYNRHFQKGLDFLFKKILKKDDHLLILINNSYLSFNSLHNMQLTENKIIEVLKKEGRSARQRVERLFLNIESEKRSMQNTFASPVSAPGVGVIEFFQTYANRFINMYKRYWEEYKKNFLTLNIKKMYIFSDFLKNIKLKKWIITFYQIENFPAMNPNSIFYKKVLGYAGATGRKTFNVVEREQLAETVFPAKEAAKFFSNLDASFSFVLIPTIDDEYSKEIMRKDVSTSLENTFREIIKATGGDIYFSSDLKKTFEKLTKKKKMFYILTYAPDEGEKPGKIKVTVKNRKYKVLYDDNMRADYITAYLKKRSAKERIIGMENLKFSGKELSFVLNNFKTVKIKGKIEADLKVKITIKDNEGKSLYEKEKIVKTSKDIAHFNIGFRWLEPGLYDLMVDVTDLLTQRSAFEYKKINVAVNEKADNTDLRIGVKKSSESMLLLKRLRGYAHRVMENSFRFFCKEKITVLTLKIDPRVNASMRLNQRLLNSDLLRNSINYFFDYQLIYLNGKIREERKTLEGKKNLVKDPQKLIKSIFSERPVFAPNVLFSEKNRDKYIFKIRKRYNSSGKNQTILKFKSKFRESLFYSGEVLIDNRSSAIRKMVFDLKPNFGFRNQLGFARSLNAKLYLKCILYFDVKHGDQYFPSKVEIIETYKGGDFIRHNFGIKGWEKTRTIYRYFDYRFFNVDLEIHKKDY